MKPELLNPLPLYPTFLVLSCLAGTAATLCLAARSGLPTRRLAVLLVLTAGAALAGAKFYGLIERGGGWHGIGWEIGHGYRYPGGILGAALALPILGRVLFRGRSFLRLADVAVIGVGVAMAIMRIGCFLAGCCHGTPSSLPWAVKFPFRSIPWEAHVRLGLIGEQATASLPVHPLQIYFGLASLAVAVFLLWFRSRRRYAGQLVLFFFLLDGTAKFLLEFLRFEYAPDLQWVALGPALVAGGTLVVVRAVHRRGERPRRCVGEKGSSGELPRRPWGICGPGSHGRGGIGWRARMLRSFLAPRRGDRRDGVFRRVVGRWPQILSVRAKGICVICG